MYCKKCNINVKKDKKVCPKCGMALVPGEAKGNQAKRQRTVIIIAIVVAVAVVATFLCIFLFGRVPSELHGTWYETGGLGYLNFKPSGVMTLTSMDNSTDGAYTFNSAKDEGTIYFEGKTSTFTCDGATMSWQGSIMTKNYVEQKQMDWEGMFDQFGG